MHKQILMNWLESISIDWQFLEEDSMEQKYQYGIVTNVQNHLFQNLKNIIDHGKIPVLQKNVKNVVIQNSLEKTEHLIHGWILVFHLCLLQNSTEMMNFSKKHIRRNKTSSKRYCSNMVVLYTTSM